MKPARAISLMSALIYNSIFAFFVADWFYAVFWSDKALLADEEFGALDIGYMLLIAYNAIFHFPVFIMNACIIGKELQLQVYNNMGNVFTGTDGVRMQLGLLDFGVGLE